MNPDVVVNITDASAEVSSTDYSLILIVSDEKIFDYKEYDLSSGIAASGIATDYPTTTDTYKKALAVSSQVPCPSKIAVIGCTATTSTPQEVTDKLDALISEHDTFFRLLATYELGTVKVAIATWAQQNKKFAYLQYDNTTFTEDYTTIGARLFLHKTVNEHLDAASAGYAAARIPGTFIPKFKTLIGITPQALTAAEKTAAEAKNMDYYLRVTGIDMERSSRASNYTVSKPLYIDDLESRAYIQNEISNKLLTLMVNTAKVPGDINGLQMIDGVISGVLQSSYDLQIVASKDDGAADYTTNVSNATFNKSTRQWSGITFNYKYLHGTELISVTGTVR